MTDTGQRAVATTAGPRQGAETLPAGGATGPAGPGPGGRGGGDARGTGRLGDVIFRRLSVGAAMVVLAVILAIGVFLVAKALPALQANQGNFLTTKDFFGNDNPPVFGIAALVYGTLVASLIAVVLAVPVAIGVALFISHYAPRRLASALGYVVDLLAAVPSVVYGLWGVQFLNGPVRDGLSPFLEKWLGWIPLFATDSGAGPYGRSIFLAGLVLAVMILPIVAAISREVFLQAPKTHEEAALALGATRWEMIRTAVLPYGRPGVISASLLGLGRALGETIAVALVLSTLNDISVKVLRPGGNTIAGNIANQFGESGDLGRGALVASGLALFIITLAVNAAARAIVARRRDFSGTAS